MKNQAILISLTQNDFETVVFDCVDRALKYSKSEQSSTAPPSDTPEYLSREQVANMFNVSLPTLWAWCNKGYLKSYRLGNKVRFLKSEVLAAPVPIPPKATGEPSTPKPSKQKGGAKP